MKRQCVLPVFPPGIDGLEKLAKRIEVIAQEVRYAEKPSDIDYPRWLLIKTSRELHLFMMEWLEFRLKFDKKDRGIFPRV